MTKTPTQDSQNPMPPLGMVLGPYPPCSVCASDGYPADIEVTMKGNDAWLCLDCFAKHMPPSVRRAFPVDKAKALKLREEPWTRSWRGWKRRTREEASEQPTLFIPGT